MSAPMDRRRFLLGAGVALGLPAFESFARQAPAPRRLVAVCSNLGFLEKNLYPAAAGKDFAATPYLEPLEPFRGSYTLCSGLAHPEVGGGHSAEDCFLTGAPHPGTPSFRNTISLDQAAVERIGLRTRFPSLSLAVSQKGHPSLSWTASGVMLPAERSPAEIFKALFVDGSAAEVEKQVEGLRVGRSVLDAVSDRARSLRSGLGAADRERLDQYAEAVREAERRLLTGEEWERKPKPKAGAPAPQDGEHLLGKLEAMFALVRLALAADSTRLVTLMVRLDGFGAHVPGVSDECHNLSHHVGRQEKIDQLANLEKALFRSLAGFLKGLADAREEGVALLDRTSVLFGSNLGNGNNHDNRNLPVLVAGGGFRHAGHLAFDKQRNTPLANLYVTLLRRLGIETDRFASSTGPLKGLGDLP